MNENPPGGGFPNMDALLEHVLDRIQHRESGGVINARGKAGELGAFQIKPTTAREYGITNPKDLYNPVISRRVAKQILKDGLTQFGSLPMAVASYNAGPGNVKKGRIPASTRDYMADVLKGLPGMDSISPPSGGLRLQQAQPKLPSMRPAPSAPPPLAAPTPAGPPAAAPPPSPSSTLEIPSKVPPSSNTLELPQIPGLPKLPLMRGTFDPAPAGAASASGFPTFAPPAAPPGSPAPAVGGPPPQPPALNAAGFPMMPQAGIAEAAPPPAAAPAAKPPPPVPPTPGAAKVPGLLSRAVGALGPASASAAEPEEMPPPWTGGTPPSLPKGVFRGPMPGAAPVAPAMPLRPSAITSPPSGSFIPTLTPSGPRFTFKPAETTATVTNEQKLAKMRENIIPQLEEMQSLYQNRLRPKLESGTISSVGQGLEYTEPGMMRAAGYENDPDVMEWATKAGPLAAALNAYYAAGGGAKGGIGLYEKATLPHVPHPPGGVGEVTGIWSSTGQQWDLKKQGEQIPILIHNLQRDAGQVPPTQYQQWTPADEDLLRSHGFNK